MINIRRSFSKKLSVALFLLAVPIVVVSLGVLFTQSRQMIRNEAIGHASSVLGATMQQLRRNLITIETIASMAASSISIFMVSETTISSIQSFLTDFLWQFVRFFLTDTHL